MEGENRDLIQVVGGVPQFCKNVPSELNSLVGKSMRQIALGDLLVTDPKTQKPIPSSIGNDFVHEDRVEAGLAADEEGAHLFHLEADGVGALCVVINNTVEGVWLTNYDKRIQKAVEERRRQEQIGADVYAVAMGQADDNENERRVWTR